MNREMRTWTIFTAITAIGIAMALAMRVVSAEPLGITDAGDRINMIGAAPLMRFYPAQLPSTPPGVVEDRDVWLAKVQGMLAVAPSLFQQSLLSSQSTQDFRANVALLQSIQAGMISDARLGQRAQGKAAGELKALGDSANLVYTELEPCRIMDSRNASAASGVHGPLVGNTLYSLPGFITAGQNWGTYGQTGTLSDCGLNSIYGSSIDAVAIVITILNPNFSAFLGVSDVANLSSVLSSVALNYTRGQGISTLYIVPQNTNQIYFAMPAGLSANIVFDVVGFFHISDATALNCTTSAPNTVSIAANGTAQPFPPSCPAGFTTVATTCFADSFFVNLVVTDGSCAYHNVDASAHNVTAKRTCCQVPGR